MSVELRIGSLALHGIAAGDAVRVRSQLEGELSRLLAGDHETLARESVRMPNATATLPAGTRSPDALGIAAARAIHARLTP